MIFLDNASTTKLNEVAKTEIIKSQGLFFNPSAVYGAGLDIKNKIENAKKEICKALGTDYKNNLIFTGSATEANNLAIFGSIKKTSEQLIFSIGEHPSVYNCALELKARGYNVQFISLKENGEVDLEQLKELLKSPTSFVSIMQVSNETGAINDIEKIVKIVKQKHPRAIIHCDGVQAFGKISVNVDNLGVDLYTISAHKIHGPKGIGALYSKYIKKLKPIIFGGEQEFGIRSGTENTQSILALSEVVKNFKIREDIEKVKILNNYVRDFFKLKADFCHSEVNKVTEESSQPNRFLASLRMTETINPKIKLNSPENASPYILSFSFEGVRGETLVHMLENKGVIIGTGSACSSKKGSLNRILESIKLTKKQNEGSVRISFSNENTLKEIKIACEKILETYIELLSKLN